MNEKELERILKALANKRRILILKYLKSKHNASVGEIASHIELSFKATSKHLVILLRLDIVDTEQVGLSMIYSLVRKQNPLVKKLLELV